MFFYLPSATLGSKSLQCADIQIIAGLQMRLQIAPHLQPFLYYLVASDVRMADVQIAACRRGWRTNVRVMDV